MPAGPLPPIPSRHLNMSASVGSINPLTSPPPRPTFLAAPARLPVQPASRAPRASSWPSPSSQRSLSPPGTRPASGSSDIHHRFSPVVRQWAEARGHPFAAQEWPARGSPEYYSALSRQDRAHLARRALAGGADGLLTFAAGNDTVQYIGSCVPLVDFFPQSKTKQSLNRSVLQLQAVLRGGGAEHAERDVPGGAGHWQQPLLGSNQVKHFFNKMVVMCQTFLSSISSVLLTFPFRPA